LRIKLETQPAPANELKTAHLVSMTIKEPFYGCTF